MKRRIKKQFTLMATMLLCLLLSKSIIAQTTEYEKAIARFTGEQKYDIEKPGALDGVAAPEFEGTTLDGTKVSLSSLSGKVVVLNFWFIACAPCRIEAKPLNEIVEAYKGKNVVFVSVARDKEDALRKHLPENPFSFEVISDASAKISSNTYHLFGYPTTIVIDKNGKIRYYSLGGKINEEAVRKELSKNLVPAIDSCLTK